MHFLEVTYHTKPYGTLVFRCLDTNFLLDVRYSIYRFQSLAAFRSHLSPVCALMSVLLENCEGGLLYPRNRVGSCYMSGTAAGDTLEVAGLKYDDRNTNKKQQLDVYY